MSVTDRVLGAFADEVDGDTRPLRWKRNMSDTVLVTMTEAPRNIIDETIVMFRMQVGGFVMIYPDPAKATKSVTWWEIYSYLSSLPGDSNDIHVFVVANDRTTMPVVASVASDNLLERYHSVWTSSPTASIVEDTNLAFAYNATDRCLVMPTSSDLKIFHDGVEYARFHFIEADAGPNMALQYVMANQVLLEANKMTAEECADKMFGHADGTDCIIVSTLGVQLDCPVGMIVGHLLQGVVKKRLHEFEVEIWRQDARVDKSRQVFDLMSMLANPRGMKTMRELHEDTYDWYTEHLKEYRMKA